MQIGASQKRRQVELYRKTRLDAFKLFAALFVSAAGVTVVWHFANYHPVLMVAAAFIWGSAFGSWSVSHMLLRDIKYFFHL